MISTAALPASAAPAGPSAAKQANPAEFSRNAELEKKLGPKNSGGQPREMPPKAEKWNLANVRVGFDLTRKGKSLNFHKLYVTHSL